MFEQQFVVFKEVADTKNITLAAKRLHMSQPSISLQIQNMENLYGARFFNRTNKGVTLTKAGEVFYDHVNNSTFAARKSVQTQSTTGLG